MFENAFLISFVLPWIPFIICRYKEWSSWKPEMKHYVLPIFTYLIPIVLQWTPISSGSASNWFIEAIILNTTVSVLLLGMAFRNKQTLANVLIFVSPLVLGIILKIIVPSLPE